MKDEVVTKSEIFDTNGPKGMQAEDNTTYDPNRRITGGNDWISTQLTMINGLKHEYELEDIKQLNETFSYLPIPDEDDSYHPNFEEKDPQIYFRTYDSNEDFEDDGGIESEYLLDDMDKLTDFYNEVDFQKEDETSQQELEEVIVSLISINSQLVDQSTKKFEQRFSEQFGDLASLVKTYLIKGKITNTDLNELYPSANSIEFPKQVHEAVLGFYRQFNHFKGVFKEGAFSVYNKPVTVMPNVDDDKFFDLENHIDNHTPGIVSSKFKNVSEVKYFCKVEELLPEDVDFGNDGGCCIATDDYNEEDPDENEALDTATYQLDWGIPIVGIYQQVKSRKPKRVGMVLSFVTADGKMKPRLLANSAELSDSMNPLDEEGLTALVDHVVGYTTRWAKESGLGDTIGMGTHDYNTARNYLEENEFEVPDKKDELMKIPSYKGDKDDIFYSEVLTGEGYAKDGTWGWLVPN